MYLDENFLQARLLFSKYGNKIASWISTKELSVIIGLLRREVVGLVFNQKIHKRGSRIWIQY